MSTDTLSPRKTSAPTKPKKDGGIQIAPEATGDPPVDRILWDLASKIEGVGGKGWTTGEMQENPLVYDDGLRQEHTRPTKIAPIKWHLYDKSKRTRGKGVELWMNDVKIIGADNKLTSTVVSTTDHGGLAGLGDAADHTWAALVDGSRDITGLQDFNASVRIKESAAVNYLTLAQAADAARTVTFPDATTTLAGLGVAQTFTANQTISGSTPKLTFTDTDALHDDYSIAVDTASFKIVNDTDTRDDLAIDGGGSAVFGGNLSAIGALRLRGGATNYYTLAKADDVARTITFPGADTTLAGLSVAQTFTANQTFETTSGAAVQVGTTNTTADIVVGELAGATTYSAIGLQGSLAFGTGAVPQANLYMSSTDTIFYINNRLNGNISMRINNTDALIIRGTDRVVTVTDGLISNAYLNAAGGFQLAGVAVTLTAAQINDAALKSAANTFTAAQTISQATTPLSLASSTDGERR